MAWSPQSKKWKSNKAVLFVHGVGDFVDGDYDYLLDTFKDSIGETLYNELAVYFLYYDDINDYALRKNNWTKQLSGMTHSIASFFEQSADDKDIISEYIGDVLYPLLLPQYRKMVRDRLLNQVQQIRMDGYAHTNSISSLEISIICHSLGNFHTYEFLHKACDDTGYNLQPFTDNMVFKNVLMMAPPIQLIRTVSGKLDFLLSQKSDIATLKPEGLFLPFQRNEKFGETRYIADNFVSYTGSEDPVGGYILGKKLDWAFTKMEKLVEHIDIQNLFAQGTTFKSMLMDAVSKGKKPWNAFQNPHSWKGYIERHGKELKTWLGNAL